jgi:DNA-binding transcriptional LysR family regulator
MAKEYLDDLAAFLTVAEARSFTRAAAQLGMSQPALSAKITALEERLGVRLLTRTTRSVSTTEAGERLARSIGPHFDGIAAGLADLGESRGKPAGTLRITSVEHASQSILLPALAKLLPDYPEITVEVINDYGLADIVAERFDAGIRLGEQVAQDMIAVRIGPDFAQCVVGAPAYFARHGKPVTPDALTGHQCIALRLPTSGGGWTRTAGAPRWPAVVQHDHAPARQCPCRAGIGEPARGRRQRTPGERQAGACSGGLVPIDVRIPPLLSEPAPATRGVFPAGRGAEVPGVSGPHRAA